MIKVQKWIDQRYPQQSNSLLVKAGIKLNENDELVLERTKEHDDIELLKKSLAGIDRSGQENLKIFQVNNFYF